ncbi:MAG: ABC transporter permease subunit [Acidobacteriota bacterium]|nr:ABC transporter permease subunit [Acidobacteriota bacterium]
MKNPNLARIMRNDRVARWVISIGGLSILACMLLMVVYLFQMALPLFYGPDHRPLSDFQGERPLSFGLGTYAERAYLLFSDGRVDVVSTRDGSRLKRLQLPKQGKILRADYGGNADQPDVHRYNLVWEDNSVSMMDFVFKTRFSKNGERQVELHVVQQGPGVQLPPDAAPDTPVALRLSPEGTGFFVCLLESGAVYYRRLEPAGPPDGNMVRYLEAELQGRLTHLTVDHTGGNVFAGTNAGELIAWSLEENPERELKTQTPPTRRPVTGLRLLYGERSLAVADKAGEISAWQIHPTRHRLEKLRDLKGHKNAVTALSVAAQSKSVLSLDSEGGLQMSFLTSGKLLLKLDEGLQDFALSQRGDHLLSLDAAGRYTLWQLHAPHPETDFGTLFGKVHYEGYPEPSYTWQSSAVDDDVEPKLSLMPLIWGSLKGTFYGMLFSLPLALLAAGYTAHIMAPRWRAVVKPTVELMAAVPSVVLGFLAALWLAPRLEHHLLSLALVPLLIILLVGAGLYLLFRIGHKMNGYEFLWVVPLIPAACYLSLVLGGQIQDVFFNGDLNLYLYRNLGMRVEQRNCIVIGIALGFAVIPVIFTIAEDAFYNVPQDMTTAATALGSSRWQTLWRIALPMAGPGIFAAVMIGLGRAVGETMIVLMATGNTPIMTLGPLNGMRTLAANIAVEIPEAPYLSTLYRVLFLSALLLFVMTFVINTLAEVVRSRLQGRREGLL